MRFEVTEATKIHKRTNNTRVSTVARTSWLEIRHVNRVSVVIVRINGDYREKLESGGIQNLYLNRIK